MIEQVLIKLYSSSVKKDIPAHGFGNHHIMKMWKYHYSIIVFYWSSTPHYYSDSVKQYHYSIIVFYWSSTPHYYSDPVKQYHYSIIEFYWSSTPHYYSDQATHCTWPGFELYTTGVEVNVIQCETILTRYCINIAVCMKF